MPSHPLLTLAHQARARRTGELPHDLAVFTGLLRAAGSAVSPAATLRAQRALTMIALEQPRDVRAALECCLTSGAQDRARFGTVYDSFWTAETSLLAGLADQARSGTRLRRTRRGRPPRLRPRAGPGVTDHPVRAGWRAGPPGADTRAKGAR